MGIGPTVTKWSEWAEVFNKLEVWRDLVQAILKQNGIPYKNIQSGYPGTSAVFMIDREYVLKVYPGDFITDHEREWPVLKLLENIYAEPLLVTSGFFKDDNMSWPYAILRYIDGTAYREVSGRLKQAEKTHFISSLATMLRKIHGISYKQLEGISAYRWSLTDGDILQKIDLLCGLSFFNRQDFRNDLHRFIEQEKGQLESEKKVFVHGDLTRDHLFFKKINGEWVFSDVIDWGDAHIAPALYDFVVLWAEVFSDRQDEWKTLIHEYNEKWDTNDAHFQRHFTAMLFLHPFACDLIMNAYNNRKSYAKPTFFQSVQAFIDWAFITLQTSVKPPPQNRV